MKGSYPINKFLTEIAQKKPKKILLFSVGNPLPKFDNTRHNAGHMALNFFIENLGGLSTAGAYEDSSVAMAPLQDHPSIVMAKSLEYMNNSGRAFLNAIRKMSDDYRVIVLHDDIDTNAGSVKFKLDSRQVGAHGGLNSILKRYSEPYCRIRLGIGAPMGRSPGEVASYVLKKFPPQEKDQFENKVLLDSLDLVKQIIAVMEKEPKKKKPRAPKFDLKKAPSRESFNLAQEPDNKK